MNDTAKRDNGYWLNRLDKDGHHNLLARIDAGEITVYRATQLAGYRKQGPRSPAAKLSHHWKRASAGERRRFVTAHAKEVNRVLHEVRDELVKLKAEKSNEADQK